MNLRSASEQNLYWTFSAVSDTVVRIWNLSPAELSWNLRRTPKSLQGKKKGSWATRASQVDGSWLGSAKS